MTSNVKMSGYSNIPAVVGHYDVASRDPMNDNVNRVASGGRQICVNKSDRPAHTNKKSNAYVGRAASQGYGAH